MIFNIILIVLFAVQTITLLIITIIRNREIDKEIENTKKQSADLENSYFHFYDFAQPYRLMWDEWYQNQFKNKFEEVKND